jgi:hypothetical protein
VTTRYVAATGSLLLGVALAAVPVELLDADWDPLWLIWVAWQTLPFVSLALAIVGGVEAGRALAAAVGITLVAIVAYSLVAAAPAEETFLLIIFLPIVLLPLTRILLRVELG